MTETVRALVACSDCKRQYDAAGLTAGQRFHCHCGGIVTVPEIRAHDAAVVRCSSCGGPREGMAKNCGFCGATFSLTDRELGTICPTCATRVAHRAKFCHSCGDRLAPVGSAGTATDLDCPVCEQKLRDRRHGELSLLECPGCAGMWLDPGGFDRVLELARKQAAGPSLEPPKGGGKPPAHASTPQSGPLYRKCPTCRGLMDRRNFGRRSGVIVDRCSQHGVWFDADELERIVAWIRAGGEVRTAEASMREAKQRESRVRLDKRIDDMSRQGSGAYYAGSGGGFGSRDSGGFFEMLGAGILFDGIFDSLFD